MIIDVFGLEHLPLEHKKPTIEVITRLFEAPILEAFSLEIALVDDKMMKSLQKEFKGKTHTTDILSFPTPEPERYFPHLEGMLGELIISVPQAKKQARQCGHSFPEEMAVLCAHGLMHLLGFDHERSIQEALRQLQGEMILLELAGVNPRLALIGRQP
jgi:probable rRNA maturation factor